MLPHTVKCVLALIFLALPSFAEDQGRLQLVTTTGMIADAARNIGGELVTVRNLMGPGVDPHAFRQTRTDIVAMAQADLVLWHGLYLEAQLEEFLLKLGERHNNVAVADGIPRELLIEHRDYDGKYDPHLWMDPELWSRVVINIRDALVRTAPEHADIFHANTEVYVAAIDQLATYADAVLSSVPSGSRVLVSAHDAFGYFGAAYGFEVVGIQGISTESEAGLMRVSGLVEMIVERDIRAVFTESSVSDRNIRAIIQGAAAQGHDVVVGGELFSDAMGEPGTYEGTYLGMIDHNVTVIARALGGAAPVRGMANLLN